LEDDRVLRSECIDSPTACRGVLGIGKKGLKATQAPLHFMHFGWQQIILIHVAYLAYLLDSSVPSVLPLID